MIFWNIQFYSFTSWITITTVKIQDIQDTSITPKALYAAPFQSHPCPHPVSGNDWFVPCHYSFALSRMPCRWSIPNVNFETFFHSSICLWNSSNVFQCASIVYSFLFIYFLWSIFHCVHMQIVCYPFIMKDIWAITFSGIMNRTAVNIICRSIVHCEWQSLD